MYTGIKLSLSYIASMKLKQTISWKVVPCTRSKDVLGLFGAMWLLPCWCVGDAVIFSRTRSYLSFLPVDAMFYRLVPVEDRQPSTSILPFQFRFFCFRFFCFFCFCAFGFIAYSYKRIVWWIICFYQDGNLFTGEKMALNTRFASSQVILVACPYFCFWCLFAQHTILSCLLETAILVLFHLFLFIGITPWRLHLYIRVFTLSVSNGLGVWFIRKVDLQSVARPACLLTCVSADLLPSTVLKHLYMYILITPVYIVSVSGVWRCFVYFIYIILVLFTKAVIYVHW